MKKALFILFTLAFISQSSAYDKLSLVERFTNASCAPCASLNVWYNPLTQGWVNSGTISHLVYNVWWPGPNDPMYLLNVNDNTTRTNYYGCNYVPWFDVNGTHVNETQSALTSAVTNGNNQFAPFNIEMTQEALGENLIKIGVTITRDPSDVTTFGNIKLRVALTEKTVSFASPPGSNGETEFYSICRKMLPDAGGSTFTIPAPEESTQLSLEYVPTAAFLQAVNLDSLRIVAFIQDVATKMVYQSAMMEAVPNYVATIHSTSPDILGDKNTAGEFTTILRNIGLMDDMYYINCTFDGPGDWTGGFTTVNGNFVFGETDSVQVISGDSTEISLTIDPNGFNGSGVATLSFQSINNVGMDGSVTFRFVTTTGIDILIIDASGEGYGNIIATSIANVFSGSFGVVSQNALNPSAQLDNFQMVTWSAGRALPVFRQDEVDALQDYLDNGGKLFINGQDIGADVFGTGGQSHFAQGFYNYYLHTSFVGNVTIYLINGILGDPITDGIQIILNDIYPRSPDNILPFDGNATPIFNFLSGPNIAGIKASLNDYKVVYFAFGFEQIPSSETRDSLISRIINYFGVNINTVSSFQLTVNVTDKWNMISIPGNHPDGNIIDNWWPYRDSLSNLFRYNNGYQSVDTLVPGTGYWMKHTGARVYNTGDEWPASGIQVTPHVPIPGNEGWNLFGGYELSVPASGVTTVPPGLQTGPIYWYSSVGYQTATTLEPGYCYFMKLTGAGQIIIPESSDKGREVTFLFKKDWGKIVITDATGVSYTLYAIKGKVDLRQYELPPAPPGGMFDIRFSSERIAEDINSSVKTINMSGVTYPLKIKVENMDIRLMDETGKIVNASLMEGEDVVINNPTLQKLMVTGELIPDRYSLEQNYPNPFNPSTKIKYSIPKKSQIQIKVFNTLGEEIRTLITEEKPAGEYEVEFNGTSLPSGIYFYQLNAESYTQTKKMILLR